MPSIEEQIEQIRRAPTNNAIALFLHSLLPWNDPNAPAEEHDMQSRAERAMRLLGMNQGGPRQPRERLSDDDEPANNNAEDSSTEE